MDTLHASCTTRKRLYWRRHEPPRDQHERAHSATERARPQVVALDAPRPLRSAQERGQGRAHERAARERRGRVGDELKRGVLGGVEGGDEERRVVGAEDCAHAFGVEGLTCPVQGGEPSPVRRAHHNATNIRQLGNRKFCQTKGGECKLARSGASPPASGTLGPERVLRRSIACCRRI